MKPFRTSTYAREFMRTLAILGLLALPAQRSQAIPPVTFNVSNTADSGAGSLRQAVIDSYSAGPNTVSWTTGSGGTIFLQSDLTAIHTNTTLDVSNAPSAVTISSKSVEINGTVTLTNNSLPQVWTINTRITGTGSMIKDGTGELDLSGANDYSGNTVLIKGTLGLKNSTALGSGTLLYDGGTLQLGAVNAANNIQLSAGGVFDTAGSNAALSGVISETAAYSLTKAGAGTLFLTGANTYSGGTVINAGTLNINADAALGNAAGGINFNGGTLQAAAGLTSARVLTLNAGGGTFDSNGFDSTLSGGIAGTGSLTKAGAGTLFLTGINSYSGGTFINAGTLNINSAAALGSAGAALAFSGGTLQTAASVVLGNPGTLNAGGGTVDTNGFSSVFLGVFGGTGGLTKAGAGIPTLSGVNTYTGGTTISGGTLGVGTDSNLGDPSGALTFNGGTLALSADFASGRSVSLSGNGTIDTGVKNSTFTGVISGGGALTKLGSGTLFLEDANSYSGGTVLSAGTINVSSASALGSGQLIFNGAATLQTLLGITFTSSVTLNAASNFDMMGNTTTISGVIGGTGNLLLISSGTLALTGVNTYTGGSSVSNAGVLSINNGSALGTGALVLAGGTLQTTAPLTFTNTIYMGGAGTIDAYGQVSTFSGSISDGPGAGPGLTITDTLGGGTIILSGANTYTGGTYVNGGTLRLGADNAVSTAGGLTVNSGGTFDMSGFNQAVASYAGAGTLSMTQPSGLTNFLTVNGNSDLSGGTLVVKLAPQLVANGATFRPVRAAFVTGTLPTVVSPAAFLMTPTYAGADLKLTVSFVPFSHSAVNPNQTAIGDSLEALRTNPTGDAATVIGELYTLDAAQLRAALDQIGPISLAAMGSLGLAGSGVQGAALGQRLNALADGTAPDGVTNYTVSGRMDVPGGPLLAYAGDDLNSLDLGAARQGPASNSPWGFYASGVASTGRLSEATSSSGLQPGYAFNTGGLMAGGDYRLNRNLAVGGSAGYLHGHASVYAPGSGTVDNNSARYGVYATSYNETARASLYLGGASDFFSTRRGIQFGQISRVATASPQGAEFNLAASASFDLKAKAWGLGTFSPFAGLDYNRLMIGSFQESGADTLDLSVAPQTAQSLQSSLGLRYSDRLQWDSCTVLPYLSLGWRHEFEDQSHPIEAQLASGVGSVFSVATGRFARDGTLFGTGFSLDWGRGLTAKFAYAGDFRSHFQDNNYDATLRYKF
ncbi:MAG: autotransporter domain-containing protein [Elusimicrobia bacterium]|nr:autotransporter domain-containing protein [Elusimicrobiota bacterium]